MTDYIDGFTNILEKTYDTIYERLGVSSSLLKEPKPIVLFNRSEKYNRVISNLKKKIMCLLVKRSLDTVKINDNRHLTKIAQQDITVYKVIEERETILGLTKKYKAAYYRHFVYRKRKEYHSPLCISYSLSDDNKNIVFFINNGFHSFTSIEAARNLKASDFDVPEGYRKYVIGEFIIK